MYVKLTFKLVKETQQLTSVCQPAAVSVLNFARLFGLCADTSWTEHHPVLCRIA